MMKFECEGTLKTLVHGMRELILPSNVCSDEQGVLWQQLLCVKAPKRGLLETERSHRLNERHRPRTLRKLAVCNIMVEQQLLCELLCSMMVVDVDM